MRRVLLADGADVVTEDLTLALGNLFVSQSCNDARLLEQQVEDFDPQLMVLDIHMLGAQSEKLLKRLQEKDVPVIVMSNIQTDYLVRMLENCGVRWLVIKPVWSDSVARWLLELELEMDQVPDRKLRCGAYRALCDVKVWPRHPGFMALAEALVCLMDDPERKVDHGLYEYIALKCGGTPESVEMSMRRCIERAFLRRGYGTWNGVFGAGPHTQAPTNGKFIKHLAQVAKKYTAKL